MAEQIDDPGQDSAVGNVLRSAVQNVIQAGSTPEEIRAALGLGGNVNLLSVQNGTVQIEVNSPGGKAYFIKESGPSWVQYIDHRPHDEWEETVSPIEFDPALPINIAVPDQQSEG